MADRHHRAPNDEGKLYLCAVKDACSKRIVGYSIDERMTSQLAVNALRNAVALRGPAEAIVHSDRGSQFRSHAYQRVLRNAGLHGSMGRVGTCAVTGPTRRYAVVWELARPGPDRDLATAARGKGRLCAPGTQRLAALCLPCDPQFAHRHCQW